MHREILPGVIFSPARLAIDLAEGLQAGGAQVTLFTPGPVETSVTNETADLSLFEKELGARGDTYLELLKKHPFTFVTLARQVQSEIVARAYQMANNGDLDIVHIYTNEEDIALPFASLCSKPVVFTHHDPFNFLVKYKSVFPKYKRCNWISMSLAQRAAMPPDTNWLANISHGLPKDLYNFEPSGRDYIAYLGRIIEPKGVHVAIQAVKEYNRQAARPVSLKIAGKHYAGYKKDVYWQTKIQPEIDGHAVQYAGYIKETSAKQAFLGGAKLLMVPSLFDEPFGMVMIEAMACGTPVLGLGSGAIPEVIEDGRSGIVAAKVLDPAGRLDETATANALAAAIPRAAKISRQSARQAFERRFTTEHMCADHLAAYRKLVIG
jgi:glycosyltransferase involved in cell wall biosynthesis